jgi:hypothetical protein
MTHANVGSLLVFDPARVPEASRGDAAHPRDAVAGIVTERDYLTKVGGAEGLGFLGFRVSGRSV